MLRIASTFYRTGKKKKLRKHYFTVNVGWFVLLSFMFHLFLVSFIKYFALNAIINFAACMIKNIINSISPKKQAAL